MLELLISEFLPKILQVFFFSLKMEATICGIKSWNVRLLLNRAKQKRKRKKAVSKITKL